MAVRSHKDEVSQTCDIQNFGSHSYPFSNPHDNNFHRTENETLQALAQMTDEKLHELQMSESVLSEANLSKTPKSQIPNYLIYSMSTRPKVINWSV